jgi:hypothetical protein
MNTELEEIAGHLLQRAVGGMDMEQLGRWSRGYRYGREVSAYDGASGPESELIGQQMGASNLRP